MRDATGDMTGDRGPSDSSTVSMDEVLGKRREFPVDDLGVDVRWRLLLPMRFNP